jgi:hypothetical protein
MGYGLWGLGASVAARLVQRHAGLRLAAMRSFGLGLRARFILRSQESSDGEVEKGSHRIPAPCAGCEMQSRATLCAVQRRVMG